MRFRVLRAVKLVTLFTSLVLFLHILFSVHSYKPKDWSLEQVGDSPLKVEVDNNGNGRGLQDGFRDVDIGIRWQQRSAKSSFEDVNNKPEKSVTTNFQSQETKNRFLLEDDRHRRTELSDVFISVKTSKQFHKSRVDPILKSWFTLARSQTYFFTDADDEEFQNKSGGHMINTQCGSTHRRQALCCKMSVEYDTYLDSNKRWFCHVDDDNYVNIPQLVKLLQNYHHNEDWYLGKPSLNHPMNIRDRVPPFRKIEFWFATGGAGMCISRSLALKMMPHASGGRLNTVGNYIQLGDDCVLGYIICYLLKKDLTVIERFRSHMEDLSVIKRAHLHSQIILSYSHTKRKTNTINVKGLSREEDPTRFLSLHCYLFPTVKECGHTLPKNHTSASR